jgi:Putative DNA-binding domain
MVIFTPDDLLRALRAGEFDRLVGTPESDWLDLKVEPYRLDTAKDRWEIAKDVAAFANHQGGRIVIGVQTARQPHEVVDIAVKVRPVPLTLIDPKRHQDVLIERIYPPLQGLELAWHRSDPAALKGLFVITVPPQPANNRPFIVNRTLDEDGKETTRAFAIPQREGGVTVPLLVGQVHRLISEGLQTGEVAEPRQATHGVDLQARAEERLDQLEAWQGWETLPAYFLQAIPPPGTHLQDLHEHGGLRGALEHMNVLRPEGFNLRARSSLEVRDGGLAYLADSRRALWLDPDGTLTVGALATYNYLGWAMDQTRPSGIRPDQVLLNPIVVVEFTLEFFRFVHRELVPRAKRGRWAFRVVCRRMHAQPHGPVALARGVPSGGFLSEFRLAFADTWKKTFDGPATAGEDAFSALRLVYELFGQPPSVIPFVIDGEISEKEILRL